MRWRTTAGAVVAGCATFALLASTAFATPGSLGFGKCAAQAGGKFKNGGCTKLAKSPEEQKFEWTPLASTVGFTSEKNPETPNAVLESASGVEVSCKSQVQEEGEYAAAKEQSNVVERFSGCETLGTACHNEGEQASEGRIHTNKLRGVPGVITPNPMGKEQKDTLGIDLKPQTATNVAEFECGPAPVIVRGGVIYPVPANKMLNKLTVSFSAEKGGKQVPEGFYGAAKEVLEESYASPNYSQTSLSLIALQKNSAKQKVELRQCEKNVC
jgi:hypothetical protein